MTSLPLIATAVGRVFRQLAPPEVWKRFSFVGFIAVHSEGGNKVWVFGVSRARRS